MPVNTVKNSKSIFHFLFKYFCLIIFQIFFLCSSFVLAETVSSSKFSYLVKPVYFSEERDRFQLEVVQPYSFDLKTIQKSMATLFYQTRITQTWRKAKKVFPSSSIKIMAPLFVKEFALANDKHRLIFKIKEKSGKTVLRGDTFLTKEGLNWRFYNIRRWKRKIGDYSVFGDFMQLKPLGGQVYKEKKRYKNLKEYYTNWIIFKGIRPVSSKIITLQPAKKKSAPPPTSSEIQRRLKILKDLKKKGMISDREYKKKRREIMKSF